MATSGMPLFVLIALLASSGALTLQNHQTLRLDVVPQEDSAVLLGATTHKEFKRLLNIGMLSSTQIVGSPFFDTLTEHEQRFLLASANFTYAQYFAAGPPGEQLIKEAFNRLERMSVYRWPYICPEENGNSDECRLRKQDTLMCNGLDVAGYAHELGNMSDMLIEMKAAVTAAVGGDTATGVDWETRSKIASLYPDGSYTEHFNQMTMPENHTAMCLDLADWHDVNRFTCHMYWAHSFCTDIPDQNGSFYGKGWPSPSVGPSSFMNATMSTGPYAGIPATDACCKCGAHRPVEEPPDALEWDATKREVLAQDEFTQLIQKTCEDIPNMEQCASKVRPGLLCQATMIATTKLLGKNDTIKAIDDALPNLFEANYLKFPVNQKYMARFFPNALKDIIEEAQAFTYSKWQEIGGADVTELKKIFHSDHHVQAQGKFDCRAPGLFNETQDKLYHPCFWRYEDKLLNQVVDYAAAKGILGKLKNLERTITHMVERPQDQLSLKTKKLQLYMLVFPGVDGNPDHFEVKQDAASTLDPGYLAMKQRVFAMHNWQKYEKRVCESIINIRPQCYARARKDLWSQALLQVIAATGMNFEEDEWAQEEERYEDLPVQRRYNGALTIQQYPSWWSPQERRDKALEDLLVPHLPEFHCCKHAVDKSMDAFNCCWAGN